MTDALDGIDWRRHNGLVPAIVQDAVTGEVLMLAYMNELALQRTLETREVHFYSRSRRCQWKKGETSGNLLALCDIALDCDGDTLLVRARPAGPVCHTGRPTCFGTENRAATGFLQELDAIVAARANAAPGESYTARLLRAGTAQAARKVGEEAVEVGLAAVTEDQAAFVGEAADLLYHLLVLLRSRGASLADVTSCLEARHREPEPHG